ncbi:aspartyl-phosphate phosphatase Spo0E family protein [Neobacillus sp. YX16]|uniref:aspartyl-phosphate phosphatase Spo0E family protein n=1 Tax=Neobacillus sp. YX16 TaxID=3047874 RepID=UPI0024C28604|nr:aspartyl-phosphate phosphatase Spo0E family protein [Neobacillus sp. YX16]WHZ00472.1 aspartyl-phosphate phosphatase Spo0E family protein [Neobacillus sp. YX16]
MPFSPITNEQSELIRIIESLRREMIQTGMKEGLTSKNTIKISRKLDEYIVKYQATHEWNANS